MKQLIVENLRRWAIEAGCRTEHSETMRTVTESPATDRKHCGVNGKLAGICQMWRAGWPASANQLISVYDNMIFGTAYDDVIMAKLRGRATTAHQVIADPALQELLSEVQATMVEEAQQRAGSPASSSMPPPPQVQPSEEDTPDAFEKRGVDQGVIADQALVEVTQQLAADDADTGESLTLERFKRQAELLVESNIAVVDELQDDTEILKVLQAHPIAAIRGDPRLKTHVLA